MDGREKKLFNVPPIRLSPETIDKVTQDYLLEQQKAVDENRPFRHSFRRDRGWVTFKNDGAWYRAKIGGEIITENDTWKKFLHFSILDVVQNDGTSSRFLAKLDDGYSWEVFAHTVCDDWLNDFNTRLGQQKHWSNEFKDLEIFPETEPQLVVLFESINDCLNMPHWTTDEQTLQEWQDLSISTEFHVVSTGYWRGAHTDDPFPNSVRKNPHRLAEDKGNQNLDKIYNVDYTGAKAPPEAAHSSSTQADRAKHNTTPSLPLVTNVHKIKLGHSNFGTGPMSDVTAPTLVNQNEIFNLYYDVDNRTQEESMRNHPQPNTRGARFFATSSYIGS